MTRITLATIVLITLAFAACASITANAATPSPEVRALRSQVASLKHTVKLTKAANVRLSKTLGAQTQQITTLTGQVTTLTGQVSQAAAGGLQAVLAGAPASLWAAVNAIWQTYPNETTLSCYSDPKPAVIYSKSTTTFSHDTDVDTSLRFDQETC